MLESQTPVEGETRVDTPVILEVCAHVGRIHVEETTVGIGGTATECTKQEARILMTTLTGWTLREILFEGESSSSVITRRRINAHRTVVHTDFNGVSSP